MHSLECDKCKHAMDRIQKEALGETWHCNNCQSEVFFDWSGRVDVTFCQTASLNEKDYGLDKNNIF